MRNNILLILFVLFIGLHGFTQSFSLSDNNGPIANGGIVQVHAHPSVVLVQYIIFITNNSAVTKNLKVKKSEITLVNGSYNTYCWANNCYGPSTYVSPDMLTLLPSQTSSRTDFYADYLPENYTGTSIIRYTCFDALNPSDSASVVVHYVISLTSNTSQITNTGNVFSNPYPNPASNFTVFDINLPQQTFGARLILRSLLGNTVAEKEITQSAGKLNLQVNELKEGIYFYTLFVQGDKPIKTGKLIVKR